MACPDEAQTQSEWEPQTRVGMSHNQSGRAADQRAGSTNQSGREPQVSVGEQTKNKQISGLEPQGREPQVSIGEKAKQRKHGWEINRSRVGNESAERVGSQRQARAR
eukprot:c19373_g1_i5.p1 GENE.c19373_g1_i5~~c19373_g1_i5.p1  ORF type:complete len:107 (-),score=4.70 c19373_g1_i5:828-1148(-)